MKKILTSAALLLVLTACSKQEFYQVPTMPGTDIPIEDPTELTVNLSAASSCTEEVTAYLITPTDGDVVAELTPGVKYDVEAGKYQLQAMNRASGVGVTLNTCVAYHNEAFEAGYAGKVGPLEAFHSAYETIDIPANTANRVELVTTAYTRPVTLNATIEGTTAEELARVTFRLQGVRTTVDLKKPFGPDNATGSATMEHTVTRFADAGERVEVKETVHLFGVDLTMDKTLTIEAETADGAVRSVDLPVDELLDGFYNLTEEEPGQLKVEMSMGVDGVNATIDGWTPGWDEEVQGQ